MCLHSYSGRLLRPSNLQTTRLRFDSSQTPSGAPSWSLVVEGQEAELSGNKFQLQELYGLSTLPPHVSDQVENEAEGEGGLAGDVGETGEAAGEGGDDVEDGEVEMGEQNPAPGTRDPMASSFEQAFQVSPGGAASPELKEGPEDGAMLALGPQGEGDCLICLSEPPTTLLLPCTHSLCRDCAIALRESTWSTRQAQAHAGKRMRKKYACPMCRRAYTALLHLSSVSTAGAGRGKD